MSFGECLTATRAFFFVLVLFAGCSERVVEKIEYGKDYCDHCKMQITDKRYGGAILTKTGRTFKFDSIECLKAEKNSLGQEIKEIYFVDFQSWELKPQKQMTLYRDIKMHGPMGTSIQAWSQETNLPKITFEEVSK